MNYIETTEVEIHCQLPDGRTQMFYGTFERLGNAIEFIRRQLVLGVKYVVLRGPRRYLDDKEIAQIAALGLARA
jgi:hypothetical protein